MKSVSGFRIFLSVVLVWFLASLLPAYAVTINKGFAPGLINPGDTSKLHFTIFNDACTGGPPCTNIILTNAAFSDTLPAGMKVASPSNAGLVASPAPFVAAECNSAGISITAVPGTNFISVSGVTVPAKSGTDDGRCDFEVDVTTTVQGNSVNSIPASPGVGSLSNTQGFSNLAAANATLAVNSTSAPILGMTLTQSTIYLGQPTKLSISVNNTAGISLTNTAWSNLLPANIVISSTPNLVVSPSCSGATVSAPANGSTISLSTATIAAGATCTVTVDVTGNLQGNYTTSMPAGAITNSQGVTNASGVSQAIAVQSFAASKSFAPATVKTNQVSTMTITINSVVAYTNLAFNDNFSSQTGLVIAPTPNASTTCTGGTVTAVAGTQVLSLSNGSIAAGTYAVPSTCIVKVDVVVPSNLNTGIKNNSIPIGGITGQSGAIPASNITAATASLTVNPYVAPTLTKSFATDPIFVGQNSVLSINVRNNDSVPFTTVGWVDNLPSGLIVNGAAAKNAACAGGSVVAPLSGTGITLSGVTIAAGATCTVTIPVTATQQGAAFLNSMPVGIITDDQGTSNTAVANATLATVRTITATKTFNGLASATVGVNVPVKLRVTISNESTHAYNSLTFTDNFSGMNANLRIAPTPNATTTCGAGSVTATAGTQVVGLTGGTVAAGVVGTPATCYVEVDVVSTAAFTIRPNTIPIGGITGVDAVNGTPASNYQAATANLTVNNTAAPTLTKTFSASPIFVGQAFNAVIAVRNNDATLALTNVAWTDTLPAGLQVNGAATKSAGCTGASTVTAPIGGVSIAMSAGTIAAGGAVTCTVTVPVIAVQDIHAPAAGFLNNMPIGAITNDQGATNAAASSATVFSRAFTAVKTFASSPVLLNVPVKLTITINNNSTHAYNSLAFTDNLALVNAGLKVAPTPNASTTCVGGTVTAVAGSSTVSLSGGTIAAGTSGVATSCNVQVDVISAVAFASSPNTLAIGAVTGTDTSNSTAASSYAATTANLAVSAITNPTLAKSFAPNTVYVGQTSVLSISVTNNDLLTSLNGVTWADTLPANLTITSAPTANANCGSPTIGTAGQTINFSGGTIPSNTTCTVTVNVTADRQSLGTNFLNTMPANAVTTNESVTDSNIRNATLTVNTLRIVKTFDGGGSAANLPNPAVGNINSPVKLRLTINNHSTHAYNNIAFTDNFGIAPSTLPATFTIAATPNLVTTCTGTVTATANTRIVSLSGGSLGAGTSGTPTSCYIEVDVIGTVAFTNQPNNIPGTDANCAGARSLQATDTTNSTTACDKAGSTANLTLGTFSSPTLGKTIAPGTVFVGENSTLTITVTNTDNSGSLTNVAWTDDLNRISGAGIVVNGVATVSPSCGAATVNTSAPPLITFTGGTIAPLAVCTVTIPITGDRTGAFVNRMGDAVAYRISDSQGVTDATTRSATLTVRALSATKDFAPGTINVGGISTLTITVRNNATTAYSNLNVTDDLSTMTNGAGVVIAPTPNASTTCNSGSQVLTATPGSQLITLTGGLIGAGTSGTATTCIIRVDVVGNNSNAAAKVNTIPIINVTATAPNLTTTNITAAVTANLTVNAATRPLITKAFSVASIKDNGIDSSIMTITINNAANSTAINGLHVTDTFPVALNGLVITGTPSTTCGGTLTATPGTNTLSLTGGTVAAGASCTITVPVVSTLPFVSSANTVNLLNDTPMTTAAGQAIVGGTLTATANIAATDILAITKSFASSSIAVGAKTQLTVTINNDSAVAKSGLNFSDNGTNSTFPSRLDVATPPNVVNTCGGSVTTGVNGFSVTGGVIPALSSCSITVDVVGVASGAAQANTINANNITTTQGRTNTVAATANITVTAATNTYNNVTKTYNLASPIPITQGVHPSYPTSLRATISWRQATGSSINPIVTDNLPTGLRVADLPNPATTCGTISSTTVTAGRDQIVIALTHNQATNQTCTVSFDITPTAIGTFTNTIAVGDIRSTDGTSVNTTTGSIAMTVTNALTIGKSFQPDQLGANGVSLLTITITNPETLSLTGASLTDNLPNLAAPNNLIIATPANATTNCTLTGTPDASKVTAVPGTRAIILTGGIIPARVGAVDGVCTVTVYVKPNGAYSSGSSVNTIPASNITTTELRTNINPASATITYVTPNLGATKQFNPLSVKGGSVSRLTVTVINPNNYPQTGVSFTDNMPVGMTIGLPPNPTTTCAGGVFTNATSGSASWSFSGGTVPANSNCLVEVNATMNVVNNLTNIIPAGGITTSNGAATTQDAQATLTNLAGASFGKSFSPNPLVVNQPTRLTISVTNSSSLTLTNMGFTDDLTRGGTQTGLTVATTPNITNTCGGTVSVDLARTLITYTVGTLAPNAVCSVGIDLVTNTEGTYSNKIPELTLTDSQLITNESPSEDIAVVYSSIKAVKQLTPVADTGRFNFTLTPSAATGSSSRTNVGHDAVPSAVTPFSVTGGTAYTITETGAGATDINDYDSTYECRNADNTVVATGSGVSATVTPPTTGSGATANQQAITCTFTNTNKSYNPGVPLTINKTTIGGTGSFAFTIANGATILPVVNVATATAGTPVSSAAQTLLNLGSSLIVTETAVPGWAITSASCTETTTLTGVAVTYTGTNTVTMPPIAAGKTYACNFTNTKTGSAITGNVFKDTGTGAGTANNGTKDGTEAGIPQVTVKLTNCAGTTYSTTSTDVNGNYSLSTLNVPAGSVCIEEMNLPSYISTGGNATAGGTYDRTTDKITFTLVTNTSYSGMNFGDVPANRLLTDGAKTGRPGSTLTYPHIFIAGSGGTVTFSLPSTIASPPLAGWSEVLYTDKNCDGVLNTNPSPVPPEGADVKTSAGAITVAEGDKICLIQQEFIPAGAPMGASNLVKVQASFVYTNASPALTANYTRQDITKVTDQALELLKMVRVDGTTDWLMTNTAKSGQTLEYQITYTNHGATPIKSLVVNDATPIYTTFVSALAGTFPANLTACQKITPSSGGSVPCANADTATGTGAIKWTFTGSLAPGASGAVTFKVKVD